MRLNIGDRKKYRILERKRRSMKIRFKNNNKIFDGSVKKIAQNMLLVQTVETGEQIPDRYKSKALKDYEIA